MPYFKGFNKRNPNIIYVHIPKTGGTSIEYYFCTKYKVKLFNNVLYSGASKNPTEVSLQHKTLDYILTNQKIFKINMINTLILTSVRNPYNRIISELLFLSYKYSKGYISDCFKIDMNTTKEEIYNNLKRVFNAYKTNNNIYDNHIRPQYHFLINKQNQIDSNIKIIKTENLKEDMNKLGYIDFNLNVVHDNKNKNNNYHSLLNTDSIKLINDFYHEDFIRFGYKKLDTVI